MNLKKRRLGIEWSLPSQAIEEWRDRAWEVKRLWNKKARDISYGFLFLASCLLLIDSMARNIKGLGVFLLTGHMLRLVPRLIAYDR